MRGSSCSCNCSMPSVRPIPIDVYRVNLVKKSWDWETAKSNFSNSCCCSSTPRNEMEKFLIDFFDKESVNTNEILSALDVVTYNY